MISSSLRAALIQFVENVEIMTYFISTRNNDNNISQDSLEK